MKQRIVAIVLTLTIGTLVAIADMSARQSQPRAGGNLTIEQLIDIRHPSSPVWSPDGRHVAFLSERAGIGNIFVADVAASSAPAEARALTRFPDGQRIYFPRTGDLWQVAVMGGEPTAVWSTPQGESNITPSPDLARVAFVRTASAAAAATPPAGGRAGRGGAGAGGGDLMVRSLADGKETVVLRGENHAI